MTDTVLRYMATLRAIPRQPRKTTVGDIHLQLQAAGYDINKRSVERDLNKLSSVFPITNDGQSRPAGWYWPAHEPDLTAPGPSINEALELELLGRYLKPLLPRMSWAALQPRLRTAEATLDRLGSAAIKRWRARVAVLDEGQPLGLPEVSAEVVSVVHESLLNRRCLAVDYRSMSSEAPRRYELNPVALVYQGQVGYLVATLWNYTDLRHLALHRMQNAELMDAKARQPAGFDLQRYLRDEEAFNFPRETSLRLVLRVSEWLARYLEERPLSDDQRIAPEVGSEKTHRVHATVRETERLIWWLRSQGDAVEVLKPTRLRTRLANEFAGLAARYTRST